ncbi:NUDIX domain-containing protein [Granulicatella sp. zg-ZJ]|uniref:8-oxo-dGTP diphosphatase n=1 Tax=Granulicatella sp. zg-ZJ TaxID=2678504 RepID=UPI0013D333E6|nr:8-oxo-dGTP diphosphatase [Granulicatella sp. zg-ZJ]NEW62741.1 NUDIX domain-containing protein [Granulicatella sp. zg-ZJ]
MNVILTNMCMIQDTYTKQVLVQNRVKTWTGLAFPGGHVEPFESMHDSVVREVKEETGLDISDVVLCGVKDYVDKKGNLQVVLCYKTSSFSGELVQNEQEGQVSWMNLEHLTLENTPRGFLDMLPLFLSKKTECHYTLNGEHILY